MFDLKKLHHEAVPEALEKAERYRLLNEPAEAESICLDILQVEPANQKALVILLLALTDEFAEGGSATVEQARAVLPRLAEEYDRHYYSGIICERRAKALLRNDTAGSRHIAYDWFRQAMSWYEKAEAIRPASNADALLRWNTCARILMRNPDLRPIVEEPGYEPVLE
jgi:hypothetical protein